MPSIHDLPPEIGALVYKTAITIGDSRTEVRKGLNQLLERIKDRHARHGGALKNIDQLDTDMLIRRFKLAKEVIRFSGLWSSRWSSLREAIRTSLSRANTLRRTKPKLQILLLDPSHQAICIQRDRDLKKLNAGEGYTASNIRANLTELANLYNSLRSEGIDGRQFQVKLYRAIPSRVIYLADEFALIGTHPVGKMSADAPHTPVFGSKSSLYRSIELHFNNLWETIPDEHILTHDQMLEIAGRRSE
jgi:hypothetical protein